MSVSRSLDQEEATYAVLAYFTARSPWYQFEVVQWLFLLYNSTEKGSKQICWKGYHQQAESIIKFCLIQRSFLVHKNSLTTCMQMQPSFLFAAQVNVSSFS